MAISLSKRYILDSVYPELLLYGHYSGCHQLDERSFHYGIRKFPVCARCTGVACGLLIGLALLPFNVPLIIFILLCLPLVLDGIVQLKTGYRSNNYKRLLTGILFGTSILNLVVIVTSFAIGAVF